MESSKYLYVWKERCQKVKHDTENIGVSYTETSFMSLYY